MPFAPNQEYSLDPQLNDEKALSVAALDIGSNSFHMVVARRVGQDFQIQERIKQQVRLAADISEDGILLEPAFERAFACLDSFAEHIQGVPPANIRAVATQSLRLAKNAEDFLERALQHFPVPITVISGIEEARLIYKGVTHISDIHRRMLVVDIGGGSTEFAIGANQVAKRLRSTPMGCVNLTKKFLESGKITKRRFNEMVNEVDHQISQFDEEFKRAGWDICLGSSGSIKAVVNILKEQGFHKRSITHDHLLRLRDEVVDLGQLNKIALPGLSPQRGVILPAALAILVGVFQRLGLDRMEYSRGALREGMLFDMLDPPQE